MYTLNDVRSFILRVLYERHWLSTLYMFDPLQYVYTLLLVIPGDTKKWHILTLKSDLTLLPARFKYQMNRAGSTVLLVFEVFKNNNFQMSYITL